MWILTGPCANSRQVLIIDGCFERCGFCEDLVRILEKCGFCHGLVRILEKKGVDSGTSMQILCDSVGILAHRWTSCAPVLGFWHIDAHPGRYTAQLGPYTVQAWTVYGPDSTVYRPAWTVYGGAALFQGGDLHRWLARAQKGTSHITKGRQAARLPVGVAASRYREAARPPVGLAPLRLHRAPGRGQGHRR